MLRVSAANLVASTLVVLAVASLHMGCWRARECVQCDDIVVPFPDENRAPVVSLRHGEQTENRMRVCADRQFDKAAWLRLFERNGYQAEAREPMTGVFGVPVVVRFRNEGFVGELVSVPAGSERCWNHVFRIQRLSVGGVPARWTIPRHSLLPSIDGRPIFGPDSRYPPE
jgi:hypothetical protein